MPARDASTSGRCPGFSNSTGSVPRLHITLTSPRSITSQFFSSSKITFVCPGSPSFNEARPAPQRESACDTTPASPRCRPLCTSSHFSFDRSKRLHVLRIGNVLRIPPKRGELASPPLLHCPRHLRILMVGEVLKRRRRRKLLPLKDHRNKRRRQHESRRNLRAIHPDHLLHPVSNRPIPHLIVILDEPQKLMRRKILHRPPMPASAILRVRCPSCTNIFVSDFASFAIDPKSA